MAARITPAVGEPLVGVHLWGGEFPWLPDLLAEGRLGTVTGRPLRDAFGRQIAFLRAIAATAPAGSALQLRFTVRDEPGRRIRIHLFGRAPSAQAASRLARIVTSVLPTELPFEPIDLSDLASSLCSIEAIGPDQWAEVRRAIETLRPRRDVDADHGDLTEPVALPWNWSPHALLGSLALLREQRGAACLGVHIEPHTMSLETLDYLSLSIGRIRDLTREDDSPLAAAALVAYRRWLRELPRAAVRIRVFLASEDPLALGIAEAVGIDVTRGWENEGLSGGFSVIRPDTLAAAEQARLLYEELDARLWRPTTEPPELDELADVFDPYEANSVFRFPVTAEGGIAGVATGRIPRLPQGARRFQSSTGAVLGVDSAGEPLVLSHSELNRHVLVAGLPGFGKTTTVQAVISNLQVEDRPIPFLVIDPAKTDYGKLDVPGLHVIDLDPDCVGFNPFGTPSGSTSRKHAARIASAFDSAFSFSRIFPLGGLLLSQAIADSYELAAPASPTLNLLYATLADNLARSDYRGDQASNLRGSLLDRVASLGQGVLGKTLTGGPDDCIDWVELCSRPTVIQLRAFTAPAERSLVFALLLAGLISYREANTAPTLKHVTVLEEAHRVLGHRSGQDTPDGTRAFAEAIAELRGAGEGFVIVEQAPSLLDPAILKITGSKIVHRTVERDERVLLGQSMLLRADQLDDLGRLAPGRAVVHTADAEQAVVVHVNLDALPGSREFRSSAGFARAASAGEPLVCRDCPAACFGRQGATSMTAVALLLPDAEAAARHALEITRTSAEAICASWWATGTALDGDRSARRAARRIMRNIISQEGNS